MNAPTVIGLATILFASSLPQPVVAQSQTGSASNAERRCGEAVEPRVAVGKTFHGPFQWDRGTVFYWYVTFNADCSVTTIVPGSMPKTEGRWEQTSEGLFWEPIKDARTVYKGSVYSDGTVRGEMFGRGGYRGKFTLRPEK